MRHPSAISILPPLALLAISASARAEEVIEVPPIEVTATAPPKAEAPASARTDRVVEPSELDAPQGPTTPLARLPSVQVLSAGGPGQPATVAIRGSDPSATLATMDGVPLNSPYMGGADLSGLSLVTLDSLDLVRGARSASHGTDAVGGLVAARTPDPLDGTRTRAVLTLGSFLTGRLKASHAHAWEAGRNEAGFLVAAGAQGSEGTFPFTDTNGRRRERGHNGSYGFEGLARAAGRFGGKQRVDLTVEGAWDMHDSRIGTMGVLALLLVLAIKVTALAQLDGAVRRKALLCAPLAGRCLQVAVMALMPYARPEGGLASVFLRGRPIPRILCAGVCLVASALALFGLRGGTVIAVAVIVAATLLSLWSLRRIGGFTGDTLGATSEFVEAVVLAAALAG